MSSTKRIQTVAGTLVVGFLLAAAFAATGLAGNKVPSGVVARAQATNAYYQLNTVDSTAVQARAQATNRFYGLGSDRAIQAEKLRSEAINQAYHLGQYAVIEGSSSFDWTDAGIGAGATLGTLLVAGGLAIVARRRLSSATTT
jgi:hypothetical protein